LVNRSDRGGAQAIAEPGGTEPTAEAPGAALGLVFHMDEVLWPLNIKLKELLATAAIAIDGSSHLKEIPKAVPGSYMKFDPAPNSPPHSGDSQKDFNWWILTRAMSDCVEELKPLLARASVACSLVQLAPDFRFTLNELRDKLGNDDEHETWVANMNFPSIWDHLHDEYPDLADPPLRGAVESLNKARNCLVHGGGVVRKRDLDRGGTVFTLKWLRMVPWVIDANGEHEMNVDAEPVTSSTMEVAFKPTLTTIELKVGSTLEFDAQMFVEVCMTLHFFANELGEAITKLWTKHGVPMHSGPVTKIVDWEKQVFNGAAQQAAEASPANSSSATALPEPGDSHGGLPSS
jgi:hypothetical protein